MSGTDVFQMRIQIARTKNNEIRYSQSREPIVHRCITHSPIANSDTYHTHSHTPLANSQTQT